MTNEFLYIFLFRNDITITKNIAEEISNPGMELELDFLISDLPSPLILMPDAAESAASLLLTFMSQAYEPIVSFKTVVPART